ncbi:archaetidylserine decarboxylase [Fictibacillus terranigra]|uniref:Phosphatidylserine decarboxylase proenzyme n=1 Tax=Fictibacillus terranigra TaxID=3058424 RepID=A0ABT8E5U0_9BACL|nr:archaetidylserine decarboxylase [Fictibacillus sp. CENA-BCM004]MDN4073283.1 archaetidylserine decarboxylase [Fictibacillus sp. CENA-BCM004]
MKHRVAKLFISMLPQNGISRIAGSFGRSKMSRWYVKPYAKMYDINVSEIEKPIQDYKHLTEFFSRRLKINARPIEQSPASIISPVDGVVSQMGRIQRGTLIQAKGIDYSVHSLLGEAKKDFDEGSFITIYLSPKDYHRIHMPLDGEITSSTYIPGRLFPVNDIGVNHVKGLFTKNERLITYADTDAGEVAIVKVGAFIVGSVKVVYSEPYKRARRKVLKTAIRAEHFKKGSEIGHFEFGSTVILLFQNGQIDIDPSIKPGTAVKMGQKIGKIPAR